MRVRKVILLFLGLLLTGIAIPANGERRPAAADLPSNGVYLPLDGSRLYYEECGSTKAPAIVLLHDGLIHSITWDGIWPALCARFHVVRYDRRGMGRSEPATAPFIPTEDLTALLEHLGISKATLVGSSSGAGLAIDAAIRHPDKVERLILLGPVLHGMSSSRHFEERGERNNAPMASGDVRATAKNWSEDVWQIAGKNKAARRTLFEALERNPQNLRYDGRFERHFLAPAVARVGEIRAPTLMLVGESDIPDVQAYSGAIEAGIWGAQRVVLPGCGHLIQLERPDELTDRISHFIDDHPVLEVPSSVLEGYVGTYHGALFDQDGEILLRDGRLMLHIPAEKDQPLYPASEASFYLLVWGGVKLDFECDMSGHAIAVNVTRQGKVTHANRLEASPPKTS